MKAIAKILACLTVPDSVWTQQQLSTVTGLRRSTVGWEMKHVSNVAIELVPNAEGHRGRPRRLYRLVP